MSIVTDSLDAIFSDDLTTSVYFNGIYGKGILEQPTAVTLGDQVLFYDYTLFLKNSEFNTLKNGDSIKVKDDFYTIREVQKGLDGEVLEVSIQKT